MSNSISPEMASAEDDVNSIVSSLAEWAEGRCMPIETVGKTDLVNSRMQESKTLLSRLLSGSLVLLLGSGLAAALNFVYNMSVARFLGPTAYGHATAIYTLLILISAVTLSFQIVPAKVVAQQGTLEAKGSV